MLQFKPRQASCPTGSPHPPLHPPPPLPKTHRRLAIANAIVVGGCTPAAANLLATAQARAEAQGNGGRFRSVAQASAAAQCLPGTGAAGRRL